MGDETIKLSKEKTKDGVLLRVYKSEKSNETLPVLMIPGMCADYQILEPYAKYFASEGYTAYIVSLRGREGSKEAKNMGSVSLYDYQDDAISAYDHIPHKAYVIGHSMGGLIAQMLCLARDDAKKLILIDSAPPKGVSVNLSFDATLRYVKYIPSVFLKRPFKFTANDYKAIIGNKLSKEENANCIENLCYDSGRALGEIIFGNIEIEEKRMQMPILCISGKKDRIIPPSTAKGLREKYESRIIIYDNFAHMIICEENYIKPLNDIHSFIKE